MNTEIRNPDDATATDGRGVDHEKARGAADRGPTGGPVERTGDAPAAKAGRTWDIADWFAIS